MRDLQLYLSPEAEHVLDWFHVAMRLTVLGQYAKGLARTPTRRGQSPPRETALTLLERTKHYLWHGNLFRALQTLDELDDLLLVLAAPDCEDDDWEGPVQEPQGSGELELASGIRVGALAKDGTVLH